MNRSVTLWRTLTSLSASVSNRLNGLRRNRQSVGLQIEQDIAEAKKKAFADVLNSFKNMFRDMLIRETEYMAQSAIREWWLGRQGWENDQMGGYQRATPVGGGSFPISVNIPTGNAPVRSDTGRTYVGSPTGATGGGQRRPTNPIISLRVVLPPCRLPYRKAITDTTHLTGVCLLTKSRITGK